MLQSWRASLARADARAGEFLLVGVSRWEQEGRLRAEEAARLKQRLQDPATKAALYHLGAFLVLSAIFRFPIGSAVRFFWTLAFRLKAEVEYRRKRLSPVQYRTARSVHTVPVLMLSVIPGFGAVAYVACRPLADKLLLRLAADRVVSKLPFRLARRLRLEHMLRPKARYPRPEPGEQPQPVQESAPVGVHCR